jgi:hypothetical protein
MQMYRSPEDINQFTKIEYLLTFQKRIQEIFASFGLDPTFFLEHPVVIGIRGEREREREQHITVPLSAVLLDAFIQLCKAKPGSNEEAIIKEIMGVVITYGFPKYKLRIPEKPITDRLLKDAVELKYALLEDLYSST